MEHSVSRRSFLKMAAATGVIAGLGATVGTAFAEGYTAVDSEGTKRKIRTCCRGCGKMECGVWVTVENGRAIKIEGDESCPSTLGSCCNKSVSSLQACYHPDRLRYPMKRTNPKGEDPGWVRISWDEAYDTIIEGIQSVKDKYGNESLFTMGGTGRIWSMSPYAGYGAWFMTPNTSVAWQVCKGPRHFSSALTSEYNHSWSASVERPPVYTIWASTPEVSNYDEAGRSAADTALSNAQTFISVDPRSTALGKESDIHLHLKGGTDTALALSMCDVIIEKDLVDWQFVKRWTNAAFLVVADKEPSGPEIPHIYHGANFVKTTLLTQADLEEGGSPYKYMVWDQATESLKWYNASADQADANPEYDPATDPECNTWEGEQPWPRYDGNGHADGWARRTFDGCDGEANVRPGASQCYFPYLDDFEAIDPAMYGEFEVTFKDGSKHTAIPVWQKFAERCAEYAPEIAAEITGIPAELIDQAATVYGTRVDERWGNGGILYQLGLEHHGNSIMNCRAIEILTCITGNTDGPGGQRGSTKCGVNYMGNTFDASFAAVDSPLKHPEIMAKQLGREKYPLLEWWGLWGDANTIWEAGCSGKPYPIKGGVCQSGDFMNMGNTTKAWDAIKQCEFFFDIDLWHHPTSELADVILPARHWLEVPSPRQNQGSGGTLGACVPCVEPLAETQYDPVIVEEFYHRLGIPWGWSEDNQWPTIDEELDYTVQEVATDWADFVQQFQENGWWDVKKVRPDDWGTYHRFMTGFMKKNYTLAPTASNVVPGFNTPTQKQEIWCTIMETYHGAQDALPDYRPNPDTKGENPELWEEYPYECLTGRRIPVYFHSEHRQLPWCREVWPVPKMEINPEDAAELGLEQGEWVWIESPHGKVRQTVDIFTGIKKGTINAEHTWWYPELSAPEHGWRLSCINQLVNNEIGDPHCGSSVVRGYPVKIYKATAENSPFGNPVPCDYDGTPIITDATDPRLKAWAPVYEGRDE